jgi:hypothetical protein
MACYYFKMIPETGSPVYLEDEPIGWDAVQITLKRDRDWHGVNYEFTDGDVRLGFDCLAGRDLIEEIYQAQGGDGYIGFQFGYYDGATFHVDFDGKINLYTRKWQDYKIMASIERNNDADKIKTRWSTKNSMVATQSLDGIAITPPTPYDLSLHSKTLQQSYFKKIEPEGTFATQPTFAERNQHDVWFVFNTQLANPGVGDIDTTIGSNLGATGINPVTSTLGQLFDLKANGAFVFDFNKLSFGFSIKLVSTSFGGVPKIYAWSMNVWLDIYDANNNLKYHKIVAAKTGTGAGQFLTNQNVLGPVFQYSFNLNAGDKVFFYAHFNFTGNSSSWKDIEAAIVTYSGSIGVTAQTFTVPTQADVFLIHEALDQSIAVITGNQNQLYSQFFGRTDIGYAMDGCGALKTILNGFGARRFNIADHPLQVSFQEQMQSLDAIFCIGMGYEAGVIRIEDREYFYNDQEVIALSDIGDYSEEVSKELVFNSINIGYQKYLEASNAQANGGQQLIDQFATEHQYATPIKSNEANYGKLSAFIASGDALEVTRRYQFADTKQDSTTYDDDTFMVAVIRNGLGYSTEKDAAFTTVTGILDPSTVYNIRHTPHRNLLNHAKWLNGGLFYKSGGELIKNTFVKQNGELVTQLDSSDPCPLGDVDYALLQEKADVYLTMFGDKANIFIPEWVTCTTRLPMETIRDIKNCMTGQDLSGRNYGYISFPNPSGDTVQGWLYDMTYSPVTEKVTFTFLKKKVIPLIPVPTFVCSDYADYTFAMFEALPNLSPDIEQCRFLNFN